MLGRRTAPERGTVRPGRSDESPWRRVTVGVALLGGVMVAGTIGYLVLGLGFVDALYQTVITVTTVGYKEVGAEGGEADTAYRIFTMVLLLAGVGAVLYTLTVLFETIVEGRITDLFWRRRMERDLAALRDHVIICGSGRLGRTVADYLANAGSDVVVIDRDAEVLSGQPHLWVHGDATDDEVLDAAGLDRARALIAALDSDAGNLYVTLTARSARPDLFLISRARVEGAEAKMRQAGADRVINPQFIGGRRIAAMTLQPHVADFMDVVMHDGSLEFRLEEVRVPDGSPLDGMTLREAHLRDRTGAMVLAVRKPDGSFLTNPPPDTPLGEGEVLITIGTGEQLRALGDLIAAGGGASPDR